MNFDKLLYYADNFVQRYFLQIIATLFVHLLIIGILILLEISKPEINQNNALVIDIQNDKEDASALEAANKMLQNHNSSQGDGEVKNVEKNMANGNKSFQDYYREATNVLNQGKSNESFQANDYKDQRVLIKDYSKETPDIQEWNKPQQNQNSNIKNQNSTSTFAGNAIVSYDMGGRRMLRLPIPAYKCQGYGKVTIEIEVNQRGIVTSAKIAETEASLNESCLPNSAYEAALSSRFMANDKAPSIQKGFIYYTFIAQ
jgi:hypothetical protein